MPQRIVLPLDIEIHAEDRFTWPDAFPGVIARGVLTSALAFRVCACHGRDDAHAHHPECPAADLLNAAQGGGRRYAIGPVQLGADRLAFRLFLYGPAARSYDRLADALDTLVHHGVGEERGNAAWCTMARSGTTFYDTREGHLVFPGEPERIAAPWLACAVGAQAPTALRLATPLDLGWKQRGAPQDALSAGSLARAFVRRWSALEDGASPTPPVMVRKQAAAWLAAIEQAGATLRDGGWMETARHSAHQRRAMTFSGLRGTLEAHAPDDALASLAEALTLLPIGGRTAFGFGSLLPA